MPLQFKRKLLKIKPYLKWISILGVLFVFLSILIKIIIPTYKFAKKNNITLKFIASLIYGGDLPIRQYKGRTDILILGISGGDHHGTDLTDTIILLSIDFKNKDAVMLSVPRDLWIPSLKAKINTAYHYGEKKKKDGGLILAKASVSEVTGRLIDYGVLIDFAGFKKIIDLIGGIEIEVEQTFEDKRFPIPGKEDDFCGGDPSFSCRYEIVKFEKGWQKMDGELALKYVRSRNAEGEEGTDFARSRRQQKLIIAVKDKILRLSTWRDMLKMKKIISAINETITSDMNLSEKILFLKFFLSLPDENIRKLTLESDSVQFAESKKEKKPSYLVNPPIWKYDGLWVLEPRTGNFAEIHNYISCQFENPNCQLKP